MLKRIAVAAAGVVAVDLLVTFVRVSHLGIPRVSMDYWVGMMLGSIVDPIVLLVVAVVGTPIFRSSNRLPRALLAGVAGGAIALALADIVLQQLDFMIPAERPAAVLFTCIGAVLAAWLFDGLAANWRRRPPVGER